MQRLKNKNIQYILQNINDKNADNNTSAFSFSPSFEIEKQLIEKGYRKIAGIDEAGRGALAGPLAVGLTIYDTQFIKSADPEILKNITDSKKLTSKKRILALELICRHSICTCVSYSSHKTIDSTNINLATKHAILKILQKIPEKPDIILLDGNFSFDLRIPAISIIKGDLKSISIASASIVAKVKRDNILDKFDNIYPGYNLKKNKGYGTKEHIEKITDIGIASIHRKSYEPVKSIISGQGEIFNL